MQESGLGFLYSYRSDQKIPMAICATTLDRTNDDGDAVLEQSIAPLD
jgi:hypothetical protein